MGEKRRKLGWLPDRPDFRDVFYNILKVPEKKRNVEQPIVDLRKFCPPVYDQGDLGSCVSQSIAGMIEFNRIQQKIEDFVPSRLFIYYNSRAREGTIKDDAGAFIRTGIKSVAADGYSHEMLWPYDIKNFKKRPPVLTYADAKKFKAVTYYRLDNTRINNLKTCLNESECFVFGATIYDSFFQGDDNGGIVPMPDGDDKDQGGHAMMCVGYDDKREVFIIRNSWGDKVGDKGYYYMPYEYMTNENLVDDCWTIRIVT